MRVKWLRQRLAAAAWAWILAGGPVMAEPLPASAVVQDLTFFRDDWAARDRSFSQQAHRRMMAFLDGEIARARPMDGVGE